MRLARSLATALTAGLALPRAVRLAAATSGGDQVERFVAAIPEERLATSSISETLSACPHMTPDFLGVLRTAETTGAMGLCGGSRSSTRTASGERPRARAAPPTP